MPPVAVGALDRLRFRRSEEDWLVAGVCGGLGARLGVDPVVLRLALVALSFAGGAGIAIYLVLWAVTEDQLGPTRVSTPRRTTTQQSASIALITVGLLLLLREMGLWFGDGLVWPVAVATLGSGLLWARDDESRLSWLRRGPGEEAPVATSLGSSLAQVGLVRMIVGGALVAVGMVGFLAANDRLGAVTDLALAFLVAVVGLGLVFGPWLSRLVGQLGAERRERIRTEERAAVAAHLHDSVLQTLALIQRAADQPARTRALARRQERELRAWLYGQAGEGSGDQPGTFGEALARLATDIEQDHDVRVEAVVVGDGPIDAPGRELLAAVREAVANAARHAGVDAVDVFLEGDESEVVATVRDRGAGFDPDEVADDRHGVRHSIRGRLKRAGGQASLTTAPGEGTEWELRVPRPDRPGDPPAAPPTVPPTSTGSSTPAAPTSPSTPAAPTGPASGDHDA